MLDHRRAGVAVPGDQSEHRRRADLGPAAHQFDSRKWRHLRGFEQNRRTRRERGHQVQGQHRQREVPRFDHAHQRVGPVDRGELLDPEQRRVRLGVTVGEELLGVARPVPDRVGDGERFEAGVAARLPGLRHQDLGQVLGVVEDPVLPLHHPALPAARSDRLPLGLEQPQFARTGGDGLRVLDRHRADDPTGGGVAHGDGVGGGTGGRFNRGHDWSSRSRDRKARPAPSLSPAGRPRQAR